MAEREPTHRPGLTNLREDWRVRLGVGAVVAILGVWFVVGNSDSTQVQLFLWAVDVPLIWVLLAMVALGVVIDRLVIWRRGRGRGRG